MNCVDSFIRLVVTLPVLSVVTGSAATFYFVCLQPYLPAGSLVPQSLLLLSFVVSALIANFIAPRMRISQWGRERWKSGDFISG